MIASIGDNLWAFVVVGGFVLLGIAMLVAKAMNKVTPAEEARTEQATHDLYQEQDREDATRD